MVTPAEAEATKIMLNDDWKNTVDAIKAYARDATTEIELWEEAIGEWIPMRHPLFNSTDKKYRIRPIISASREPCRGNIVISKQNSVRYVVVDMSHWYERKLIGIHSVNIPVYISNEMFERDYTYECP